MWIRPYWVLEFEEVNVGISLTIKPSSCQCVIVVWRLKIKDKNLFAYKFWGLRTWSIVLKPAQNMLCCCKCHPAARNQSQQWRFARKVYVRTEKESSYITNSMKASEINHSKHKKASIHPSIHHLPLLRGSGRGGSSFNRETQTSLSPATSSSSSRGAPRRSQASRET